MIIDSLAKVSIIAILSLGSQLASPKIEEHVLAAHEISLEDRYPVKSVSDIFKDNILLNLAYLNNKISSVKDIKWDELRKPAHLEFSLEPGKTFAFHDDVLDQYKNSLTKTTQAHFNAAEGFRTDGYLFGDGVCHLASIIYWVAKDASLDANAPTPHDFMPIPDISKEYGVSIYNNSGSKSSNAQQNLYVTNNKSKLITFKFDYDGSNLKVSAVEAN